MSNDDPKLDPADIELGRIEIRLMIGQSGELYTSFHAEDSDGDELPLVQVLGCLELAKDSAIRLSMGDDRGD